MDIQSQILKFWFCNNKLSFTAPKSYACIWLHPNFIFTWVMKIGSFLSLQNLHSYVLGVRQVKNDSLLDKILYSEFLQMDLANINPIKDLFSPFFDPLSDFLVTLAIVSINSICICLYYPLTLRYIDKIHLQVKEVIQTHGTSEGTFLQNNYLRTLYSWFPE